MNKQIAKTLKAIKKSASSLEIVADQATSKHSSEAHKQNMLEAVLLMLRTLERQHADLKRETEGNTHG